ncbi:MAG: DNA polymerase III subunit delta, partial [Proteobacteria bacterium]|nr:DNA polymerase III subunit delta [Pseudomonadota bacterium]
KEVRLEGKKINGEATAKLMQIAGSGLGDVKSELEKIILFVGDAGQVELSDVESAGIDVREESVFALTDAIGAKDSAAAFKIYAKLTTEAPLMLLGSIARQMRILMNLKELSRVGTPRAKLAPMAGVHPSFVGKYLTSSARFSMGELSGVFKKLARVDLQLKGGIGGGKLPAGIVITNLIMELCEQAH